MSVTYVEPDWSVQFDDDGKIFLVKFRNVTVGRILAAQLVSTSEDPLPKMVLEISGPIRIELVEGAVARYPVKGVRNPVHPDDPPVTASPTLKVTNI